MLELVPTGTCGCGREYYVAFVAGKLLDKIIPNKVQYDILPINEMP